MVSRLRAGVEWYDQHAELYDRMDGTYIDYAAIARLVAGRLARGARILDAACGTGSLSIELARLGFRVTAFDLSKQMLRVAERKAQEVGVKMDFRQGDMAASRFGTFDSVTCLFNAVGHLTRSQFQQALANFSAQLRPGGILLFDIFNADYMRARAVKGKFLDLARRDGDDMFVRFNDNKYDARREILHVNQHAFAQFGTKMQEWKDKWDMQIYSPRELDELLSKAGFSVIERFGSLSREEPFNPVDSLFIVTLAKKK